MNSKNSRTEPKETNEQFPMIFSFEWRRTCLGYPKKFMTF